VIRCAASTLLDATRTYSYNVFARRTIHPDFLREDCMVAFRAGIQDVSSVLPLFVLAQRWHSPLMRSLRFASARSVSMTCQFIELGYTLLLRMLGGDVTRILPRFRA
jgi:hypothetical protein